MISVLIPCRNYGRFLAECLDSVLAQQVTEELEILVLDDASSDETAEVCRQYPQVRYIRKNVSEGVSAARNQLLREMKGDYFIFLDADDIWLQGLLQAQLDFLKEHPASASVGCGIHQFKGPVPAPPYSANFHSEGILTARLIRTGVQKQIGFFDESLPKGEDTDFIVRMCHFGFSTSDNLPEVYLLYRIHGDNLSLSPGSVKKNLAAILRKNMKLKEAAGNSASV